MIIDARFARRRETWEMNVMRSSWLVFPFLIACSATTQSHEDQIRPRAAADLKCPPKSVGFTELRFGELYRASGCGAEMNYELRQGAWVPTEKSAPPPPADHAAE